jgi:hypothetical protein
MADRWEIGIEAQELDKKSISERMKVERSSIKKFIGALMIYSLFMVLFYFFI